VVFSSDDVTDDRFLVMAVSLVISENKEKVMTNRKGFTLIEVLLVLAILLIIARYVFAPELYIWENSMWSSIGVPPELARSIAAVGFLSFLIWRAIAERKSKKRNRFLN
jgi:prepilin-type N-terminal cleavage/methylation domain-containing protein